MRQYTIHRTLNGAFRFTVHAGRCLVQDKDIRILQERARQCNELPLPKTEPLARFARYKSPTAFKAINKRVRADRRRGSGCGLVY